MARRRRKKRIKEVKKKPFKLKLPNEKQGFTAALIGILGAIILVLLTYSYGWSITGLFWFLAIVGIIIGILNIFHKEAILFLIAGLTTVFMLNVLAGLTLFSEGIVVLFKAIIYILAPASIIVGLKVLYAVATK